MTQATDPVRVLHITDPHLFADSDSSLRGTATQQSLEQVLNHIKASAWPADVVAMTGDLIQDDSAAAYQRFCENFRGLNLPVHCVPGNHDIRDLMRPALNQPPFHYCDSVSLGNWLMIGIDSCLAKSAGGEVSEQEMSRLKQALDNTAAAHVLVCLHHPPLPVGSTWLDQVGLVNGESFLEEIGSSGKVRGVIFGHVHQEFDATHGNIRIIGTPSTCRQFMPGSDEFAVDDQPPAYRRICLHHDGQIDAELQWLPGPLD
jgi:Icc protein